MKKAKLQCPKCSSSNLGRSHRRGIERQLLRTEVCLPYRCEECQHRFYVFRNTLQYEPFILIAGTLVFILSFAFLSTGLIRMGEWQVPQSMDRAKGSGTVTIVQPTDKMTEPRIDAAGIDRTNGQDLMNLIERDAQSQNQNRVATLKVNAGRVRESPSLNARTLFYLGNGEVVSILKTSGNWYFVQHKDKRTGWAHKSLF
jgi:DNA-directed RNA polymerase subunit RPC12/RpoP